MENLIAMLNTNLNLKRLSSTSTNPDSLRIVVFSLSENAFSNQEDYLCALPVEAVFKAISCPPINWAVDSGIGMADLGAENVTVVNLRQHFLQATSASQEEKKSSPVANSDNFLILLRTATGELCGIPVSKPPTLTDIPVSTIVPVPLSYRELAGLSWASHMAMLSDKEKQKPLKIFLLGMSKVIEKAVSQSVNKKVS
jgi:purine-binding chemotaxis protein CheW